MDQEQDQAQAQVPQPPSVRAVTISREYGSGGGEVAARLAARLGWQLVDHELVAEVARLLGENEEDCIDRDEISGSWTARLLSGLRWMEPTAGGINAPLGPDEEMRRYREAVSQVVESAYRTGQAVIVGRGSQVVLGEKRDVLHLRIVAPVDERVRYVARREGLSPAAARERIRRKDEARARYLEDQLGRKVSDAHLYDLTLNTGVFSLDDAVEFAARALTVKSRRLALPEAELGPASGLQPYPGKPGEIMPSQPAEAAASQSRRGQS